MCRQLQGVRESLPHDRRPFEEPSAPYWLVALAKSPARNSLTMLGEPLLHLGDRPLPVKRMGVEAIVLRPGRRDVLAELFLVAPRAPLQVMQLKGIEQRFRLIQPRGVWRQQARMPPVPEVRQVARRAIACVGGVTIVDQIHAPQVAVPS